MYYGSCHCGAVKFQVHSKIRSLKQCHCEVCARYGALWAYVKEGDVSLRASPNASFTYVTNDEVVAFHICRTCGNLSHWKALNNPDWPIALNMRLVDHESLADIPVLVSHNLNF